VRITGISTHVVGTPWRNLTYVQVHTDEGLTGVGETRMLGHTDALLGYLREAEANHILGSDPFAVEDLVKRMKYGDYGRAGEIVMSGIAVIEMACWDIKGKALGVPVWQLLGGKVTDKVKAYANGWYTTERTPEAYHKAARGVMERGYRALKIDPFGTGHFELDHQQSLYAVSLIEAVRDAIGPDAELMLEMHGRFSPSTAVRLAKELAPFKPAWLEEPVRRCCRRRCRTARPPGPARPGRRGRRRFRHRSARPGGHASRRRRRPAAAWSRPRSRRLRR
jgi:galactonate dehydratase